MTPDTMAMNSVLEYVHMSKLMNKIKPQLGKQEQKKIQAAVTRIINERFK